MKNYRLTARQHFPIAPETAWEFLSSPENLQKITPAHMGFEILSGADRPMYPGQIIHYRVEPFKGIRTRWVTEITHLEDGAYFVDEQRFGPYRFWHHKHFVHPFDNGTLMEDVIDYKLPLGPLGALAQSLLVRKQLTSIFRYREQALEGYFGNLPGHTPQLKIETI